MIPVTMFQRFSDVFWLGPLLYKKEAYASLDELNNELWSCVRNTKTKGEEKKIVKNKVRENTHTHTHKKERGETTDKHDIFSDSIIFSLHFY